MKAYGPDYDEDFDDDFNEQPSNIAAENKIAKGQFKLTESQLHQIIRESVYRILKEAISKTDMEEPYDGGKNFVPMTDRGVQARQMRRQLAYNKTKPNGGKFDDDYRNKTREMYKK